jgi:hypothetical protein
MLTIDWDGKHFKVKCSNPGSGSRGRTKSKLSPRALLDEIRRVYKDLAFDEENEFDLLVWRKLETKETKATYTLSVGGIGIAHDLPLEQALCALRETWRDEEEKHRDSDEEPEECSECGSREPMQFGAEDKAYFCAECGFAHLVEVR